MKIFVACLLGLLTFTTAFVVYESVAPTTNEVSVDDQYGGPFRHMHQRHKQKRQLRRQRHHKKVDVITVDGQQYVVESDE